MLVLVIDDNPDDREHERRQILKVFPDAEIEEFSGATAFEAALASEMREPSLVVTDYQLKWTDGIEIFRRVRARYPDRSVVMFTAKGSEEVAV